MDPSEARILVVDDEPQLLKVLTRYLTRLGYGVVASSSTQEAWEHIEAAPAGYALALVDMTMPGMTSEELIRKILKADARIRVIASSGYPMTLEELGAADPARVAFLHKPFTPEELGGTVRKLLQAADE